MLIETIGKPTQVPLSLVEEAIKFYGGYLLGNKLGNNIFLTIQFRRFETGCSDYAYCDYIDDNHRPRDFVITVDSRLSKKETLLALAHEMVHVKQYAKGEMKDIFRPVKMVKWHGDRYLYEEFDYWSSPWEREARAYEMELYVKFFEER